MRKDLEVFLLTQASNFIQQRLSSLTGKEKLGVTSSSLIPPEAYSLLAAGTEILVDRLPSWRSKKPAEDAREQDTPQQAASRAQKVTLGANLPVLPKSIAFFDVETTGLSKADRVVSLGAFRMQTDRIRDSYVELEYVYLLFNPERQSHFAARKVHGFDDETLSRQQSFASSAKLIHRMLQESEMIVAHNAAFDLRFLKHEFQIAGLETPEIPVFCTMQAWKQSGAAGSASLDVVCDQLHLKRNSDLHSALEDAALAMCVFMQMHGIGLDLNMSLLDHRPSNLVE